MEKPRIVVDTNIIVSAIRNGVDKKSKSYRLLQDIYRGKYEVYLSTPIYIEYERVLYYYEQVDANKFARWGWFLWIRRHGIFIEPKPTDQEHVAMNDEDDRAFFDVAKCADAKLITRNVKDYPVHELITMIDELY